MSHYLPCASTQGGKKGKKVSLCPRPMKVDESIQILPVIRVRASPSAFGLG